MTGSDTTTPAPVATPVVSRSQGTKLKDYGVSHKDLEQENFDLIAKVIYLINIGPGWSEDNTFTFPDGETWGKLEDDNEDC
ncbi:MAG: hypothetical protein ACYSTI_13230 [Planctomycetota bacterium]|jgi:hypothetical protein